MLKQKIAATALTGLLVTGCAFEPSIEAILLGERAVQDAKETSRDAQIGYFHCAGVRETNQRSCKNEYEAHTHRDQASSWDYIRPYDREMLRLGVIAFMKDNGRKCSDIKELPKYNKERDAYEVVCTNGIPHS